MDWPIVFRAHSDIEVSIVRGLLETHGIDSVPVPTVGPTSSVFPFNAEGLLEVRIAVPADQAAEAARIIEEHRDQVRAARSCRCGDWFGRLEQRIGYRFRDAACSSTP